MKTERTILIVEDDKRTSRALCKYLERNGFACLPLREGGKAKEFIPRVDLVLLDLNLPDMDGLEVLALIRERSQLPVIILSARGEGHHRILGLNQGADDYIAKPVLPGELLARVKALLRRSGIPFDEPSQYYSLDGNARVVKAGGQEIPLPGQEFKLLQVLAESPGHAFTREELLALIWREEPTLPTRRVDLAVSRIRTKFTDRNLEAPIESVWKVGYRFRNS